MLAEHGSKTQKVPYLDTTRAGYCVGMVSFSFRILRKIKKNWPNLFTISINLSEYFASYVLIQIIIEKGGDQIFVGNIL